MHPYREKERDNEKKNTAHTLVGNREHCVHVSKSLCKIAKVVVVVAMVAIQQNSVYKVVSSLKSVSFDRSLSNSSIYNFKQRKWHLR